MLLKQSPTRYKQKGFDLLKNWFLFLNFTKERKKNKSKFVSRFVLIIEIQLFSCKNISQAAGKYVATQCFSLIT